MSIRKIISDRLKQPVLIVDSYLQGKNIAGKFFHSGQVYDYVFKKDSLEYSHNDADTTFVEGYCNARLQQLGLRTDSENPYEYMQGALRMDDQCKAGVACGGVCLPRNKKCTMGQQKQHAALTERHNMLSNQEKTLQQRHKTLSKIVDRGVRKNIATGGLAGAAVGGLAGRSVTTTTTAAEGANGNQGRNSEQRSLPGKRGELARSGGGKLVHSGSSASYGVHGTVVGAVAGGAAGAATHHIAQRKANKVQEQLKNVQAEKQKVAQKRQSLTISP